MRSSLVRDIDEVRYDGLQVHGYTYGDKYEEVE
jgi:hypothetical protein